MPSLLEYAVLIEETKQGRGERNGSQHNTQTGKAKRRRPQRQSRTRSRPSISNSRIALRLRRDRRRHGPGHLRSGRRTIALRRSVRLRRAIGVVGWERGKKGRA